MIYAVIPTGDRPTEYASVVEWCKNNNVTPITIATSGAALGYGVGIVIDANDGILNISRWWNLGIDYAYKHEAEIILVLNDDAVIPEGWLDIVTRPIYAGAAGASGGRSSNTNLIAGYAFALNGGGNIYADEGLVWWYGDDDLQRQCEMNGGFAVIPGLDVGNRYANISSSRFTMQIMQDRDYFEHKWVMR